MMPEGRSFILLFVCGFLSMQDCLNIIPDYYPAELAITRLFKINVNIPTIVFDPNKSEEKCYEICCLSYNASWFTNRSINVLPEERDQINTRFYFSSKSQPITDINYIISADDPQTITNSSFNASKPTKFVVHGFFDTADTKYFKEIATALSEYEDYNVIRVDWGDGSLTAPYQAAANTRLVGCEIAHLANFLIQNFGVDPSDVHCIGHSYGSHVCGYAGERIPNLGRITGLDPGGSHFVGTPYFVRLDPSDAQFVDVIHTDDEIILNIGFGSSQSMGHTDTFVNNGKFQPGCNPVTITLDQVTQDIPDGVKDLLVCDHLRVLDYFIETLHPSACEWIAHECPSYKSFLGGNCSSCGTDNSYCTYTGIRANEYVKPSRINDKFYINTNYKDPFCMQHYVVSILLSSQQKRKIGGYLEIDIAGENGQRIENVHIFEGSDGSFNPGETKRDLFLSHTDIGKASSIHLKWKFNPLSLQCPLGLLCDTSLYIQSVQVSPISRYPESKRLASTVVGCSPNGSPTKIENGQTKEFFPRTDCQNIPSK